MTEEALFIRALELPQSDRGSFLDDACAGDTLLRARVAALLRAHDEPGSFLQKPALDLRPTEGHPPRADNDSADTAHDGEADAPAAADATGSRVGPYKLLQQIGEGGMGAVWMAEQTEPVRRKVALKIIKPGLDSRQIVARFEAERQALALMDHPNIAKVLDAGTTNVARDSVADPPRSGGLPSGQPYFVMELVKGVPITKYCDEHQLTPRQRLELLIPVCQAVQHAHQKGVIHRDIKPGNVLVALYDGVPVPKVIDFGIAKATGPKLTDKTMFTEFGAVVGTLEYMSPEQAELNQLDIDTRSDIYSLGVLLYELLTGTTPLERSKLDGTSILELLRRIREEEPPRPSTRLSTVDELPSIATRRGLDPKKLRGLMRGELDWIVMKCLEKDRARRYETANELALDLQRYLDDEPVQACPPSAGYRLRKFARRNKRALATVALLGVVLLATVGAVAGSIGWTLGDREARQARINAGIEAALAEGDGHAKEAFKFAQGEEGFDNPYQWDAAQGAAFSALKRAEALAASDEEMLAPALKARVQAFAARLLADKKDRDMVATLDDIRLKQSQPHEEGRFATIEAIPDYRQAFAAYGIKARAGHPKEAAALIRSKPRGIQAALTAALDNWFSLALARDKDKKENRQEWLWVGGVMLYADTDVWPNRVRAAFVNRDHKTFAALAEDAEALRQPPTALLFVAKVLDERGDNDKAVRLLRQVQERYPNNFWVNHDLADKLLRSKPPQREQAIVFYRVAVALRPRSGGAYVNLGHALLQNKDFAAALRAFQKAIDLAPNNVLGYAGAGNVLQTQDDLDGAFAWYQKSIDVNPKWGKSYSNRGIIRHLEGDLPGALADHKEAIRLEPENPSSWTNYGLALQRNKDLDGAIAAFQHALKLDEHHVGARVNLGGALKRAGDPAGALQAYQEAAERHPESFEAHYNLGNAWYEINDLDAAIAAFKQALKLNPKYADAHYNLGLALADSGDPAGARAAYEEAIKIRPDFADAWNNLGRLLEDQGDVDGAIDAIQKGIDASRKAIKSNRMSATLLCNLGNLLLSKKDVAGAIDAYEAAIRLRPKDARGHLNLGNALYAKGDLPAALAASEKARDLDPEMPEAHNNIGLVLYNQGKLAAAEAAFREALRLKPKYPEALSNLGNALCDRGEYAKAEEACQEAIRLKPHFATVHNNLGNVYNSQRKSAEAEAACREAVRLKPNYPEAHYGLGLALSRQQGKRAEAVAAFRESLRHNPRYFPSQFNLGLELYHLGQIDDAVTEMQKAISLKPAFVQGHYYLGQFLDRLGRAAEAEKAYREAIRLDPKEGATRYNFGIVLNKQGKSAEAEKEYREAIRLAPKYAEPRVNLGRILMGRGEVADAATLFREAAALSPKLFEAHDNLGRALSRLGKPAAAADAFRKAIELRPKDAGTYFQLGVALSAQDKPNEAAAAWREAIGLKRDYPEAHFNLGVVYDACGKRVEAAVAFREAIRCKPEWAAAHHNLGELLLALGKPAAAVAALREAARLNPKDAQAQRSLGVALQRQGQWAGAAAAFREAIRLDPQLVGARLHLGDVCVELDELDDAEAAYREVLRLRNDVAAAHYGLGMVLGKRGKLPEAEAAYREAIRLKKDYAEALSNLGGVFVRRGKHEEAAVKFREALRIDGNQPLMHANLGNVLLALDRPAEAAKAFAEAARLKPGWAVAHFSMGKALARASKWEQAAQAYCRGLEIDPADPLKWSLRAALCLRGGDGDGYRAACRDMLRRFGGTDRPETADLVARACLLAPGAAANLAPVTELADRAVKNNEKHRHYSFFAATKGLAELRAGRWAKAVEWLKRAGPKADGSGGDAAVYAALAMAHHNAGDAKEARVALDTAAAILRRMPDPEKGPALAINWPGWVEGHVLYAEAAALLKGTK